MATLITVGGSASTGTGTTFGDLIENSRRAFLSECLQAHTMIGRAFP